MASITKIKLATGLYWVDIPEADLRVLCGAPSDAVKHLIKRGLIHQMECDGRHFESGPNAILLSDALIQHSRFANLSEFPVLQMLYGQGMLIPDHPNTGRKPLLIGSAAQVRAQLHYIYHGNYGLTTLDEIIAQGVEPELARELMAVKLNFAFGTIHPSKDFLDTRVLDDGEQTLKGGVTLRRIGFNRFRFHYRGASATIDLSLRPHEAYDPCYELGFHDPGRDYFSVIHSGEGDGWDIRRPCMASILTYRGKIYIIDAGPNLRHTLYALGIHANEIEGIFHTHSHDDHFSGLPTLLRRDRPLKYFATPLVRASVAQKFAALMDSDETEFLRYFEPHDLRHDQWNDLDGLEVKPVFSPHPVENNLFHFRTLWEGGYRSYTHLADTTSLKVLEGMVERQPHPISRTFFQRVKREYLASVDVKKVDIGGGMIHGCAEDFIDDTSERLLLAHTAKPLNGEQRSIGSSASFGNVDRLIPANRDYLREQAAERLRSRFPKAPEEALTPLLNCPIERVEPGTLILRRGRIAKQIQIPITGWVEWLVADARIAYKLSTGCHIGDESLLSGEPSEGSYRSVGYVHLLRIPADLYRHVVSRHARPVKHPERRSLLHHSRLFGEGLPSERRSALGERMRQMELKRHAPLRRGRQPRIIMVERGRLELRRGDEVIAELLPGDAVSEALLRHAEQLHAARTSTLLTLPAREVEEIPVLRWKLLEIHSPWDCTCPA